MQKQVNTQKSTNNLMSSFGLIEENIELSQTQLAVKCCLRPKIYPILHPYLRNLTNSVTIFIKLKILMDFPRPPDDANQGRNYKE